MDGFLLAEHAEIAREAERLGYTDAWSFEVDHVDCFAPLAVVGLATGMRVGAALAGERVTFKGETLSVDGFRLTRPVAGPVPIHIAALRPGMLRVAGEVGDGAIINWLSAEDVPRSVAVVREAARAAGRDPGAI